MRRVLHLVVFTTVFLTIRACRPEQVVNDVRRSPYEAALASAYLKASTAVSGYTDRMLAACDDATVATIGFVAEARTTIQQRVVASGENLVARGKRLFGVEPQPRVPGDRPQENGAANPRR